MRGVTEVKLDFLSDLGLVEVWYLNPKCSRTAEDTDSPKVPPKGDLHRAAGAVQLPSFEAATALMVEKLHQRFHTSAGQSLRQSLPARNDWRTREKGFAFGVRGQVDACDEVLWLAKSSSLITNVPAEESEVLGTYRSQASLVSSF